MTKLVQVPLALFEIKALALEQRGGHIVPLIDSIINITLKDPDAWAQIAQMQPTKDTQ